MRRKRRKKEFFVAFKVIGIMKDKVKHIEEGDKIAISSVAKSKPLPWNELKWETTLWIRKITLLAKRNNLTKPLRFREEIDFETGEVRQV